MKNSLTFWTAVSDLRICTVSENFINQKAELYQPKSRIARRIHSELQNKFVEIMSTHLCVVKSSPYFCSKKYLKHFITKLIAIDLKLQAKLKSFNYDSTHYEALSSLGLWGWDCHQRGFGEIFLSYWPRREAKAWPGLPALASPTLGPIHQSSQWKTFPSSKHKMVHCREPQAAEGHGVGGMISETLSFVLTSNSISKSFMMKCLRYFLLEI